MHLSTITKSIKYLMQPSTTVVYCSKSSQVKSHLFSALHNTDCVKAAFKCQTGKQFVQ